MASLNWMLAGNRKPKAVIYINHNTGDYANKAEDFVFEYCKSKKIDAISNKITQTPPKGVSKEAWWRSQRYNLFNSILEEESVPYPIVLAHNLDDCVEQYIISTLVRFNPNKIIAYNGPSNTIRPFRTWSRKEINTYVTKHNLTWIEDPSNTNTKYLRNNVRHNILPLISNLNPGIYKYVKNLIIKEKNWTSHF